MAEIQECPIQSSSYHDHHGCALPYLCRQWTRKCGEDYILRQVPERLQVNSTSKRRSTISTLLANSRASCSAVKRGCNSELSDNSRGERFLITDHLRCSSCKIKRLNFSLRNESDVKLQKPFKNKTF